MMMMKGVLISGRPGVSQRTMATSSSPFFPSSNPFGEVQSPSPPLDSKIKTGGIPGYGIPNPGNGYGKSRRAPRQGGQQEFTTSVKKPWWTYQIPSASSFSGYLDKINSKINSLCFEPEYGSPGGGGRGGRGGGGRGGGGGGGGASGDPMKGFTYLFAFAILASGIVAYVRKSSTTSLLISTGVAVLLLISASLMGHPTYRIGTLLSLGTCMALSGVMGVRAKNSGKIFPSGVVAMMSGLMSVGYIVTLL